MKDSPSSSQYRRSLQIVFFAAAALLILHPPSDLHAATETWDGGHWSNAAWYANLNWADDTAPVSGDDLIFAGTTRLNHDAYAISDPFSISSITFDATAGAFVINNGGGGTYRLTGNITNNSANLQTIKFPFTLFGSTTVWATAGDIKLEGVISGGNALTKNGSSTLTLTGSNTFSGGSYLDSGTTTVTTNTALGTGQIHIVRGVATLDLGANGLTISNNIFYGNWGAGYKTVQLDLPGTNTGTLSGQLDMRLDASGHIRFNVGADDTLTLSGKLHRGAGGGSGLTKEGAGTLIVSSSSVPSYTGINRIEAGTLQVGTGGTGGYLNTANITNNGTLVYNRSDAITISNVISGTGNLTQNGSGTLTLTGSNTYSGGTTLNAGTLVIGNAAAAGTGTITQSSGSSLLKFDTTGTVTNDLSIYNVATTQTITLSGDITAHNATYDVASGTTLSLNGTISGSGGITKNGIGTLEVNGASNTYTGDTVVNAGTLEANASGALGASGNITVHNGGSLLVQASNAIGNSSNVNLNGGTWGFNGDISDTVGALTLSANSTIDMKDGNISLFFSSLGSALTSTTRLNVYNYTLYSDHIYFTSNANLSSSLPYISFYSGFGTGFIGSSFVEGLSSPWQVRPVPEPETWATAALLLIGGGIWMWRKRRTGSSCSVGL